MVIDEKFKEIVVSSFKKARENMLELENSLVLLKREIDELKAQNKAKSSIGNEGVLSKQASKQAVKQLSNQALVKQSETIKDFSDDIEAHFKSLTKQEFLTFLSLYQLEEEIGPVTFVDIAKSMNLSEGCVRAYIYKMISKGTPIIKKKVNNRVVHLSLSPKFRELNLKKRLSDMYYQADTSQKRVFDDY